MSSIADAINAGSLPATCNTFAPVRCADGSVAVMEFDSTGRCVARCPDSLSAAIFPFLDFSAAVVTSPVDFTPGIPGPSFGLEGARQNLSAPSQNVPMTAGASLVAGAKETAVPLIAAVLIIWWLFKSK